MTFEERRQWAYGFAVFASSAAYFVWLAVTLNTTPAGDIEFLRPMLLTLAASVVLNVLGGGIAESSKARAQGTIRDDRDRLVGQRADAVCFYVFSVLAAVPLVLALRDADNFWVANSLFAAFSVTAILGVTLRAIFYRRGI